MNVKRLKFSGFDVPVVQGIPVPVLHFGIRSSLEYHEDFCDLMCYCPVTYRYFESPVNYCPQCGLNMTKVRMRKGEAS